MNAICKEALAAAPHSLLIWWRHFDEIFLLWTHGEDKLNDFSIPDLHSVSSLPVPFPTTKSLFLDVKVMLLNDRLETDFHVNLTDKHL